MQLCGRIFKKMPPIPFCPHPAPKSLYKGESLLYNSKGLKWVETVLLKQLFQVKESVRAQQLFEPCQRNCTSCGGVIPVRIILGWFLLKATAINPSRSDEFWMRPFFLTSWKITFRWWELIWFGLYFRRPLEVLMEVVGTWPGQRGNTLQKILGYIMVTLRI